MKELTSRHSFKNDEKSYNFENSSPRNAIGYCFGILKARFLILKLQISYPIDALRDINIIVWILHGYIQIKKIDDWISRDFSVDWIPS